MHVLEVAGQVILDLAFCVLVVVVAVLIDRWLMRGGD